MITSEEHRRFCNILDSFSYDRDPSGIGTLNEKSLHNVLKNYFSSDADTREVKCGAFAADIKEDNMITEIQTGSFYGMKRKLDFFLKENRVRIVYPVIKSKRIFWIDPASGESLCSNRNVKGNSIYTLFSELLYISDFLGNPDLTLSVAEVVCDEYRLRDGWGKDNKKNAKKIDMVPVDLLDIYDIFLPDSLYDFFPEKLGDLFTRTELGKATGTGGRRLWAVMKLFTDFDIIEKTGKMDNSSRKVFYKKKINENMI